MHEIFDKLDDMFDEEEVSVGDFIQAVRLRLFLQIGLGNCKLSSASLGLPFGPTTEQGQDAM